jgi:hypothetical protein
VNWLNWFAFSWALVALLWGTALLARKGLDRLVRWLKKVDRVLFRGMLKQYVKGNVRGDDLVPFLQDCIRRYPDVWPLGVREGYQSVMDMPAESVDWALETIILRELSMNDLRELKAAS